MWPFSKPDTVTRAQHNAVVDALQAELIRERAAASNARAARDAAERRAGEQKHRAIVSGRLASEFQSERDAAHETLRKVVALETPACASIGRRMAATAKAGLPEHQVEQAA